MKQKMKLNENKLKQIIKESVKSVLNEEFGVDIEDTLKWVKKKKPELSNDEQIKFAQNIINKRKRQAEGSLSLNHERFRLSFFSPNGGYRNHDDLTKSEAKYYYLKYAKYGDVDLEYNENPEAGCFEWEECNPSYLFDDEENRGE